MHRGCVRGTAAAPVGRQDFLIPRQGISYSVAVLALSPLLPAAVAPPSGNDGSMSGGEIQTPNLLVRS